MIVSVLQCCSPEGVQHRPESDRPVAEEFALPINCYTCSSSACTLEEGLPHEDLLKQGCEEGGAFQWGLSNASEAWERAQGWPQDPMWAESNWPPGAIPELQLYQVCA